MTARAVAVAADFANDFVSALVDDTMAGALTINTDLSVTNQSAFGSEAVLGGEDGTSVIHVEHTGLAVVGENAGMEFHYKSSGITINAIPIGIKAKGEYIGATILQTIRCYGGFFEGKHSPVNKPSASPDTIVGFVGVATNNSLFQPTAATGNLVGVSGVVSSVASGAAMNNAYAFRADHPVNHDFGSRLITDLFTKPTNLIGYGFDTGQTNEWMDLSGPSIDTYGMWIPQVSKKSNAGFEQIGLRIDDQGWNAVGSGSFHSLHINGDSEWGDIVFGLDQRSQIYSDSANLVVNPKLVGSGYFDIMGDIHADKFVMNTQQTYTMANVITDRSFDANTVTLTELADVVGTMAADFQTIGLFN